MKTTELMIGDLVTFKDCQNDANPTIVKIWQIDVCENALVSINGSKALDEIAVDDDVVGIPLTAEILEKNGFIVKHPESAKRTYWKDRAGQIVGHKNRGLIYVEIAGNPVKFGYFSPYFEGHIQFVHEFQHALRLCNIDKEIEI